MQSLKLTYLDAKGYGESIRYLLCYMGLEFEDVRISFDKLPTIKNMSNIPYGKVPILEINGKVFSQTSAILRYLAPLAGIEGKNGTENYNIDMIAGVFTDLVTEVQFYLKANSPSEKAIIKQRIITEMIPYFMVRIEDVLKNNGGWMANEKLSWADFYIVGYSESLPGLIGIDLTEKYPIFKSLVERIHLLPNINEWVKKRPKSDI